jgi:hypothetical protein
MRVRVRLSLIGVGCLLCVLTACGSGGGGSDGPVSSGNSLPPSSGPGDVNNIFPIAVGSSWNYAVSVANPLAGVPPNYMDSVTVTGTQEVSGVTASVFRESNPQGSGVAVEGYYYKNNGGLAFLGTNDPTDPITPKLVPFIVGLFPAATGTVAQFAKSGIDFGSDLDLDGVNESVNVTLTNTVDAIEPVSIGIGTFAGAVKTTEHLGGTVVLSATSTNIPFSTATTRWSAPGVGVVKSSSISMIETVTSSEVMEARGYVVGGVAHGFDPVFTVQAGLPMNLLPFSEAPALATDGSKLLTATQMDAGLTAKLISPQGSALAGVNLTSTAGSSSPLAAFDGSNYWVVYSPYSGGTSGSVTSVYAKRVTAEGLPIDASPRTLVTVGGALSSITATAFAYGQGASKGLLVYSAYDMGSSQHLLYGVLVNSDGTVAGSGAFPIATDSSTHQQPAISFDGTNYFVVWKQLATNAAPQGHLYGVHVTPAGTVVEGAPTAISRAVGGQDHPSVAFDGVNYLVVWIDRRNQSNGELYGARVSPLTGLLDGSADAGGFVIHSGASLGYESPRVAYLGSEYLVSWVVPGYAVNNSPGVQAARVAITGTLPGGANRAITVSGPPSAATASQFKFPVIVARGGQGAVLWFENQSGQTLLKGSSVAPF